MVSRRRGIFHVAFPLIAIGLTGCSGNVEDVLPKREPLYKSSKSIPPLEVPPDLSSSTLNDSMVVPSLSAGRATYSDYANATQNGTTVSVSGVLPRLSNVRVERGGDERWLVVEAPPSAVWPKVRDFWLNQGFLIEMEDPSIGIMETDWGEKRSQFSQGAIRGFLSKLSSTLYGAAIRDKFRTRLEHGSVPGTTEVYISHRGAEEVSTGKVTRAQDDTGTEETRVWQPRPSDPELEAEMLNRLMIAFGVERDRAQSLVASAPARPDRAHMVRDRDGISALALDESFSRAWRRTGLALDRVGFTVEDRDRSRGLYYVRYVDPEQQVVDEEGFFGKLKFWGDDETSEANEYLISLIRDQSRTQVVVLNTDGQREKSETAERILGLLHEQLRY